MFGYSYYCDRCNKNKLGIIAYIFNHDKTGRFCGKCWNWIHLKKGSCRSCQNTYTLRSNNKYDYKLCHCGEELWLK